MPMESSLFQIPPEVLLVVLRLLDVPDVLSIRTTCRSLCKITYDHSIWVSLLREQATYLPLAPNILQLFSEDGHVRRCPTNLIEACVVKDRRIAEAWLHLRSAPPRRLIRKEPGSPGSLISLHLLVERWVVALYCDGDVRVYDTCTVDIALCASFRLDGLKTCSSHVVSVDSSGEKMILVISCANPPYFIHIYELDLRSDSLSTGKGFHLIHVLLLPTSKAIKSIETAEKLLVLSSTNDTNNIEIVKWDQSYSEQVLDPHRPVFRLNTEDVEVLWNGVIAVKFFGSHILVFRAHSLEIFQYKNYADTRNREPTPSILKYSFHMTFRDASFSNYSVTTDPLTRNTIYEMAVFACDVIQGLFHYVIRLCVSMERSIPFLDVRLISVYPLAHGVIEPLPASICPHANPSHSLTYSANFSPTPSPSFSRHHLDPASSRSHPSVVSVRHGTSHQDGSENPTTTENYSLRGFVSAQCLGPQGKRGVWVERKRTSTLREVHVWSCEPPDVGISHSDSNPNVMFASESKLQFGSRQRLLAGQHARDVVREGASPYVDEMERRVVYTLHSYDLRDDITQCAFGELGGTIALGHRSGEISVIKLELEL